MKKHKKHKKLPTFPLLESGLVLIIVGLVGFTFWYSTHAASSAKKVFLQTDQSAKAISAPTSDIGVELGRLPAGWVIGATTRSMVTLRNQSSQCQANVTYGAKLDDQTTPTALLATAVSQGYSVKDNGAVTQTIQTSDGSYNVSARQYKLTLASVPTRYVVYGLVTKGQQQVVTTVTCNKQTDLPAASQVLSAVMVKHRLL